MKKNSQSKLSVYEIITNEILGQLKKGVVPWHRPWIGGKAKNLVSKKPYRGINAFLLNNSEYSSPYWATFKQIKEKGGYVRKGEKSTIVVFWKILDTKENESPENENGDSQKKVPMLRFYRVFNLDQCEGVTPPKAETSDFECLDGFEPIDRCEKVVADWKEKPAIKHEGKRACYSPREDVVRMPKKEAFKTRESYYSVLFHECTHATGHDSRLKREGVIDVFPFGSTDYSKEELVAEMGAAFLCGICEIENKTIDNSAAYIAGWLKKLKDDPKMLVFAAAQAQKAVDMILGAEF